MIKRRAVAAGLPGSTCCHTFRATGITAYLSNGGTLEHAQRIAGPASPKTVQGRLRRGVQMATEGLVYESVVDFAADKSAPGPAESAALGGRRGRPAAAGSGDEAGTVRAVRVARGSV